MSGQDQSFLDCPHCGAPLVEDDEGTSEFAYKCSKCRRAYLYEEGTLIDYGERDTPPTPGDA